MIRGVLGVKPSQSQRPGKKSIPVQFGPWCHTFLLSTRISPQRVSFLTRTVSLLCLGFDQTRKKVEYRFGTLVDVKGFLSVRSLGILQEPGMGCALFAIVAGCYLCVKSCLFDIFDHIL